MVIQKADVQRFLAKLRLTPNDSEEAPKSVILRERQEAAELIEAMSKALVNAEAGCEKALACMVRWKSGKPYSLDGPEEAIRGQLYEVIRPGARKGTERLFALLDGQSTGTDE